MIAFLRTIMPRRTGMKIVEKPFLLSAFTALSMIEISAVVSVDSAQQDHLIGKGTWL
jgi:hypothetical protein